MDLANGECVPVTSASFDNPKAESEIQPTSTSRPAKWPLVVIVFALILTIAWWIALVGISFVLVHRLW
jgi:hypothetical protein